MFGRRQFLLATGALFAPALCRAQPAQLPAKDATIYVVGITPQFEARRLFGIWRPILDAVTRETGLRFTLRGAAAINDFEHQYSSGLFDFAYANPFFVGVRNHQGYLPLVSDHGSRLAGVLVVAKDSPVKTVRDLAGETIVFPAANALAGCMLVRAELESEHGVQVMPKYARTHDSSFLSVAVGTAIAAAGARSAFENQPAEVRDRLRILYTTRELASLPIVAHPRVPPAVRQSVQGALLRLGQTDEGRALLAKVPIRQIGVASMADYEPLRHMKLERYEN